MAEGMNDSKISVKMSKREIISDVCTVKVPNFFDLPEYDREFKLKSPTFEFANATWCFIFKSWYWKESVRSFSVFLERMNSEIKHQKIFYKIILLDTNGETYEDEQSTWHFKEDGENCTMFTFSNNKPSYDRRDTLTLIIHLVCLEFMKQNAYEAPRIENFDANMADDSKISLKLTKKLISSDVYTFQLSNLFSVEEHDDAAIKINNPHFEFAIETLCFRFHLRKFKKKKPRLDCRIIDNNVDSKLAKFFISLLDNSDKVITVDNDYDYCFSRNSKDDWFFFTIQNYTFDKLTLIINSFPLQAFDLDADNVPLPMNTGIKKLNEDFKNILFTENLTDVVLKVEGREFKCHRCILAARSPVFLAMMMNDLKEEATGVVDIKDVDPSTFPDFLNYLYTGSVESLTSESAPKLYATADMYQVNDLKEICLDHMLK